MSARIKIDENLSRHLKAPLSTAGHDVLTTEDEGLLSKPDTAVAAAAAAENRLLLTLDLEFADLRKYPPGRHPGVVLFRPRSFGPLAVNAFVERFIHDTDLDALSGCVVVVDPGRIRIRQPPLDANGPDWRETSI